MPLKATADFFFSPASRYSYLAASQVPLLEREFGCRVRWRPVHGGDIRSLRGRDPFSGIPLSGQYEPAYRERDAAAWADLYGIPFKEPRVASFDFRLLVRAAVASESFECVAEYSMTLASEIWGRGAWPIGPDLCSSVARTCGLDVVRFAHLLEQPGVEEKLAETAHEAFERGAFGVPTFFVGAQMYWGNDRIPLVRAALRKLASTGAPDGSRFTRR